jgi:hypothetical protein
MIKMALKVTGLFGRLRKGDLANEIRTKTKGCLEDAVKDYVTGTQDPSLSSRMKPGAINVYGFKRRSPEYVKQQIRRNGSDAPYNSPRYTDLTRLAQIISRGDRISALQLLRASEALARAHRTPMRKLVTRPGGYRIAISGANTLKVKLTLPGAKILNRGGGRNEAYRRQLLDLTMGAGRDRTFIYARCRQYMQQRVFTFDGGGPAKVSGLRGLNTAMRRLGRGA